MKFLKPGLYVNEYNGQTFELAYYGINDQMEVISPGFLNATEKVHSDEDSLELLLAEIEGKITFIGAIE